MKEEEGECSKERRERRWYRWVVRRGMKRHCLLEEGTKRGEEHGRNGERRGIQEG